MTASTVKSTKIANALDASPREVQDSRNLGGRLHIAVDTVEAATTSLDEADDVILLLPIPSHAVLNSLRIYNDDLDSDASPAIAANIGLYNGPEAFKDTDSSKTAYAAYAVLDADCFASAVTTLQAANTAGVEVRFEASAAANDISKVATPLWELVGLASDPNKVLVVGITVTTAAATAAAGTISLVAQYSDRN